jgi:hypothetical protein
VCWGFAFPLERAIRHLIGPPLLFLGKIFTGTINLPVAYVTSRNVTPAGTVRHSSTVEMSVDMITPPVSLAPAMGVTNGAGDMSVDANGHDSIMANGTNEGQKFIPNMIYPPPDMRSGFLLPTHWPRL